MEQTECSETLAYKIQTPGKYTEESTQNSEHGESFNALSKLNVQTVTVCPRVSYFNSLK
jgi:hypothetical protein